MLKLSRKNFIPLFFIFLTIVYMIIVSLFIFRYLPGYKVVPILPGKTESQVIFLFLGIPIIVTIPIVALKFITVFNFKFYNKFQKNYEYYYVEILDKEYKSRRFIGRALLPVSMALAVSLLINSIEILDGLFGTDRIQSIIFLSLLITPVTSLLLLGIWCMKDAGIVKIRKKLEKRIPPELSYFGKVQFQSYRGFAGISTPILYLITIISEIQLRPDITSFIILLYPIILIGVYMPLLVLYEKRIQTVGPKIIKKFGLKPLHLDAINKNIFGESRITSSVKDTDDSGKNI